MMNEAVLMNIRYCMEKLEALEKTVRAFPGMAGHQRRRAMDVLGTATSRFHLINQDFQRAAELLESEAKKS